MGMYNSDLPIRTEDTLFRNSVKQHIETAQRIIGLNTLIRIAKRQLWVVSRRLEKSYLESVPRSQFGQDLPFPNFT